jgi:hypothetical protein
LLLAEEGLDEDTTVEMCVREEHVPPQACGDGEEAEGEEEADELVVTTVSL